MDVTNGSEPGLRERATSAPVVTSDPYTRVVRGDAEDPHVLQARVLALLDFLEEFHRRRHPPVRDVVDFKDFLVRRPDLPEVPGIRLSPGAPTWLSATLIPHPDAPPLPVELVAVVRDSTMTALREPELVDDAFVVDGEV